MHLRHGGQIRRLLEGANLVVAGEYQQHLDQPLGVIDGPDGRPQPIDISSPRVGSGFASTTSSEVPMTVSGVRSSWPALAMNCRWLAKARSSRSSMMSKVSASSCSWSSNVARTAWKYEICYEDSTAIFDTSWYANINMSYPIHQCVCKTHSKDVESIIYKGCISDLTRYFH